MHGKLCCDSRGTEGGFFLHEEIFVYLQSFESHRIYISFYYCILIKQVKITRDRRNIFFYASSF